MLAAPKSGVNMGCHAMGREGYSPAEAMQMGDVALNRGVEHIGLGCLRGPRWLRYLALIILLSSSGVLCSAVGVADRTSPFKIGALTDSWGPTPQVVGLRDGLLALVHDQATFLGMSKCASCAQP
jgi:hypothetical protein